VFKSHLWGSPAVVRSDPEVRRAVLQADASAFVPWYPRSLMELMGQSSILVLGGGLQRRVHGLAGAFFKSPQLKAQVTADMQRRLAPALDAWRARGPGAAPLRIQDHAKTVRRPMPSACLFVLLCSLHRRTAPRHGSFRPSSMPAAQPCPSIAHVLG